MSNRTTPKNALIKGAAWTIVLRWTVKGLGFINTVIMARILMPADYGIVAMAFLVLGLIQALLDFGSTTALLRKKEVTREEIDSAWTLRLIQGTLAGMLLIAIAPLAVMYFAEPRIEWVMWVLGVCVIVSHAGSIGPTLAQRDFDFSMDFKIQVTQNLVRVLVTVTFGFFLGDYRALVAGIVASYATLLILPYILHPYRPRWNVTHIPEIWAVTKWLMFAGVGSYILRKGDEFAAGRIGTTAEYGQYSVGADLGQMPVGEIGPAMLRALLPVLASIKDDAERTRNAVIKTVSALNTVIWPIGLGLAAIAPQATELILGAQWSASATFVGAFAIASVLQTALSPLNTLLVLQGYSKSQMHIVWIEFAAFLCAAFLLVPDLHLVGLVYARIIGSLINLMMTATFAKQLCQLLLWPLIWALLRPILGATAMFWVVGSIIAFAPGSLTQLFFGVISGASFFAIWTILSWRIAGRPEGLESTVLDALKGRAD